MANKTKPQAITRHAPLLDLELGADTTDGRELVAYAAVFDVSVEVVDWDGHYEESIDQTAFNRTLSHHPKGDGLQTLVNHGKDIYGMPSDRFALPFARITDVSVDERGLLTKSRILHTALGDEIVELVRAGALTGMSFSAVPVRSDPDPYLDGPFKRDRDGKLTHVKRMELALREFGPAVFPCYDEAEVLALRSESLDLDPYLAGKRTLVLPDTYRSDIIEVAPPMAPAPVADPEAAPHVETLADPDPSSQLRIRLAEAEVLGATYEQGTS